MPFTDSHVSLVRRLIGNYLMCGLGSVVALGLGLVLVTPGAFGSRKAHPFLQDVEQTAQALVADEVDHRGEHRQFLIEKLAAAEPVVYCAVVSAEGTYRAHSCPARIGEACDAAVPTSRSGIHRLERIENGRHVVLPIDEYWVALNSGSARFGTLLVGTHVSRDTGIIKSLADHAPVVMLLPVGILLLGGQMLRRAAGLSSKIEEQLLRISSAAPEAASAINRLPEINSTATGWNRLVACVSKQSIETALAASLAKAVGGVREQKAERVLNNLSEGIALSDHEGRILFVNRSFCTLMGIPAGRAPESTIEHLLFGDAGPASDDLRRQLNQESLPVAFEVTRGAETANGVLRVARQPLLEEGSQGSTQVWQIRDVTQQKLAEQARTDFVNSAAHELRTPLTNIKAYAETLALNEIADLDSQKDFLNIINSEATRLARFVDELLNISSLECGSLALNLQETDTLRLLNEAIEKVQPQIQQKGLEFLTLIPPKLPELVIDKDKIAASLVNLLGNAVKYTPAGGKVSVQVSVIGGELAVSVEDTGIGMSPQDLSKICQKFFRSDDPRVRDIPGSGIGLSLVREVARSHGGRLEVHSELNKGSKFTLLIPVS
ncbi:MAG: PAS domain-containing protein [Planctomycetia bacterium]|nr:PAS domain-containing protein [Planctomycetia bacterium]